MSLMVLASCLAFAQSQGASSSAVEIVGVRDKSLDLRLRNKWPQAVAVKISWAPGSDISTRRLNDSGWLIETLKDGKWAQLTRRKGIVWGDLPAKYLEIPPGSTVTLPAVIDPPLFGINGDMRLRLVVHVWRSETNVIGVTKPIENEPLLLVSEPFSWIVKP